MSLKLLVILGGLTAVGVAVVSVSYVTLSNRNRSYSGNKTKIWFDNKGTCHYRSSSHSFSVERDKEKLDRGLNDKNVCQKLLDGELDWKDVDVDGNHVPESYKGKKNEWEKANKESKSEQEKPN